VTGSNASNGSKARRRRSPRQRLSPSLYPLHITWRHWCAKGTERCRLQTLRLRLL